MIMSDLPLIMIKCLLCTIVIESIIGIVIGIKDKKDILNVVLVNILTNPIVVTVPIYMMYRVNVQARYISLFILEVLTVIVEGFIYSKVFKYKRINPFLVALILNLGSFLIGEIINRLF